MKKIKRIKVERVCCKDECTRHLPRYAATLHVVGEGDVIGPDVELPLAQP